MEIVYQQPLQAAQTVKTITIEQYQKRREMRRRRVAKRMLKRFPLFALEEMSNEFPDYNWELFVADVTRKTRKSKSFRRPKSPLIRQGRYELYQKALLNYQTTREQKYLEEAQYLRNRLFLPFEFSVRIGDFIYTKSLPSTVHYKTVYELVARIKKVRFEDEAQFHQFFIDYLQYQNIR